LAVVAKGGTAAFRVNPLDDVAKGIVGEGGCFLLSGFWRLISDFCNW